MPAPNPFSLNAPINNATLDPLQGYDADVFVLDQATGKSILIGRFVSIQVMIRNTTEPYLTLNQRMPRYLDGEMNISWQLERGQLDARILQQTFGFSSMTPGEFLDRMPRFQISFVIDTPSLSSSGFTASSTPGGVTDRVAQGEMVLTFCKVDNLTLAATAGRSVIANRWEGLAEGITYVDRTAATSQGSSLATQNNGQYDDSLKNDPYNKSNTLQPFEWSNQSSNTLGSPDGSSVGQAIGFV